MSPVTLLYTATILPCSVILLSLFSLKDTVAKLKPLSCPSDVMSVRFLKVFNSVGPTILSIINSSLSTGCVPSCLKHAVMYPLLKMPSLDPLDFKHLDPFLNY